MFLLESRFTEPSPPAPFRYLRDGNAYSVRPEKRGQGVYWYMRKNRAGIMANLYLGPVGSLNPELLNNAVANIEDQLNPHHTPKQEATAQ